MKRFKKITALILAFITLCFPLGVQAAQYENIADLGLASKSVILMEASTGDILYEQNSEEKLPPASITKIMTLLLIYEAQKNGKISWDDKVTVDMYKRQEQ